MPRISDQQREIDEARANDEYAQVFDGEWFAPHMDEYQSQCCSCGLVHDIKFRKVARGIRMRVTVNRKETKAARRRRKKRKDA